MIATGNEVGEVKRAKNGPPGSRHWLWKTKR